MSENVRASVPVISLSFQWILMQFSMLLGLVSLTDLVLIYLVQSELKGERLTKVTLQEITTTFTAATTTTITKNIQ